MVGRQVERADLVRETEPPAMFHGARLRGIGLRVERGGRLRIDEQAANAAAPELIGEHEAARPAAGD